MVIAKKILLHRVFQFQFVGVLFIPQLVRLMFQQLFCWGHWALVGHVVAALVVVYNRSSESARWRVVLLLLTLNLSLTTLDLNVLLVKVHHFLVPVGNYSVDLPKWVFSLSTLLGWWLFEKLLIKVFGLLVDFDGGNLGALSVTRGGRLSLIW